MSILRTTITGRTATQKTVSLLTSIYKHLQCLYIHYEDEQRTQLHNISKFEKTGRCYWPECYQTVIITLCSSAHTSD